VCTVRLFFRAAKNDRPLRPIERSKRDILPFGVLNTLVVEIALGNDGL
jgi:hypothetical protein